jgi:uncharacterized membrane protein YkvA (DUF1232 family)
MTFFGMISVLMICITCAFIALLVLSCLPHSPVRDLLLQAAAWLFAGTCGAYVLLPCDLLPELFLGPLGLPDDLVALFMGVASIIAAIQSARESRAQARARRWEAEEAAREKPIRRQKTITVQGRQARLKASGKA